GQALTPSRRQTRAEAQRLAAFWQKTENPAAGSASYPEKERQSERRSRADRAARCRPRGCTRSDRRLRPAPKCAPFLSEHRATIAAAPAEILAQRRPLIEHAEEVRGT